MQLRLLKCSNDHLDQLVKISRQTFIDAFEKDNDPEDFKAYIDFAFNKNRLGKELAATDSHFYFVFGDNDLVGY